MKRIILSVAVITTIVFTSCNTKKDESNPKEVFTNFIRALKRNDLKTAEELATPSSVPKFAYFKFAKDNLTKFLAAVDTNKIELGEPIIKNDKANLPFKVTNTTISSNFALEKINNEWKVAFDMDGILSLVKDVDALPMMNFDDEQIDAKSIDSMRKVLRKEMEAQNINVDSFEKEMKKINLDDLKSLIK